MHLSVARKEPIGDAIEVSPWDSVSAREKVETARGVFFGSEPRGGWVLMSVDL